MGDEATGGAGAAATQDGGAGAGGPGAGAADAGGAKEGGAGGAPAVSKSGVRLLGGFTDGKPDAALAARLGLPAPDAGAGAAPGAAKDAGKPAVPEGYVPVARLKEVETKAREKLLRAGLDPDTGAALGGAGGEGSAGGAGGAAKDGAAKDGAAAADDANAPWRKELLPVPSPDGKLVNGKREAWADEAEYLAEVSRVTAHNTSIEAIGRAQDKAERARLAREAEDFKAEARARLDTFQKQDVPKFLDAAKITREAFDARLGVLEAMTDVPRENSQLFWNFGLNAARNGPQLVYEFAGLPAAELTRLGALPTAALHAELIRMEDRLALGLTIDGKPRAGAASGAGSRAALTDAASGANGGGRPNPRMTDAPAPPATVTGGGGARPKAYAEMTAAERHEHQNAERLAKLRARVGPR